MRMCAPILYVVATFTRCQMSQERMRRVYALRMGGGKYLGDLRYYYTTSTLSPERKPQCDATPPASHTHKTSYLVLDRSLKGQPNGELDALYIYLKRSRFARHVSALNRPRPQLFVPEFHRWKSIYGVHIAISPS